MKKYKVMLFCVSFMLGFLISIRISSPHSVDYSSDLVTLKGAIVHEIKINQELQTKIAKANQSILKFSNADYQQQQEDLQRELNLAKIDAGLTQVSGDGLQLRIAEDEYSSSIIWQTRRDADNLLYLVYLLKSYGATSMSINDQRIVTNSGIDLVEGDPRKVMINKTLLQPPYMIQVIGDIEQMKGAIFSYQIPQIFKSLGQVFTMKEVVDGSITVPRYTNNPRIENTIEDR